MSSDDEHRMLPLAELARCLNLPYNRVARLVRDGRLVPDATTNRMLLFDSARLPELRRALAAPRILSGAHKFLC